MELKKRDIYFAQKKAVFVYNFWTVFTLIRNMQFQT